MTKIQIIALAFLVLFLDCDNKSTNHENSKKVSESKTLEVDSIELLRPSFWVYGLPDPKDHHRQIIAPLYKFRYKIKAGCLVTDSLVKASDRHNKITDSILHVRIGEDWQKRFENSVDSLFTLDTLSIKIAKADSYILNFDTLTEKYNDKYNFYPNLRYTSYATTSDNIRLVVVEGYGVIHNDVGWVNYLQVTVDIKSKKVLSIEKTAYGQ